MYISVIGPVGLGKSTLAEALASRFELPLFEEPWEENPYIPLLPANVFSCQYRQLNIMREQAKTVSKASKRGPIVADRIYQECFDVFCRQYRHLVTPEEWAALEALDSTLAPTVVVPDIVFALQGPPEVALARVKKRGRQFELDNITLSYCREQDVLYRGLASKLAERTKVYILDASYDPEKVVTAALRASKLTGMLKGGD